ncbi:hypothetical protein K1719_046520 [Acacia pycnantha]|nr:hypothetical protein K1719_046520 [Acacia pycnantha]
MWQCNIIIEVLEINTTGIGAENSRFLLKTEIDSRAHLGKPIRNTTSGILRADSSGLEAMWQNSFMGKLGPAYNFKPQFRPGFIEEAYESCRKICAEYAKTFYLGTLLMTEERHKAIWVIYGQAKA